MSAPDSTTPKNNGPVKKKDGRTKHGKYNTPEYVSWTCMKQRCFNPNNGEYLNYGGRGIKVSERWLGENGFQNFLEDMGPKPSPDHSIDRYPNKDGNYEPGNCRWATDLEQGRNTNQAKNITHNGKTQCIGAWAEECGIPANVLASRLLMGWSFKRAISEPVHRNVLSVRDVIDIKKKYRPGVRGLGPVELGRKYGVSPQTIMRIVKGEIARYEAAIKALQELKDKD